MMVAHCASLPPTSFKSPNSTALCAHTHWSIGQVCTQLLLVNSSWLQCTIGPANVGRYPIIVSLNGQNSSSVGSMVAVDRLCGDGRYGLPGQPCGLCPSSAHCVGLFPVPLPLPGFYPLTLTQFSACVPLVACAGVDAMVVSAVVAQLRAGSSDSSDLFSALLTQFMSLWNATSNVSVRQALCELVEEVV